MADIEHIQIRVGKRVIRLSPEEAVSLMDSLNKTFKPDAPIQIQPTIWPYSVPDQGQTTYPCNPNTWFTWCSTPGDFNG